MNKYKKIAFIAAMLACNIVLSRFFSIKTPLLVISFAYIPTILSAYILGIKGSLIVATLGDLIGALLFPFGAFFPGFTVSAFLTGLVHGLFLNSKKGLYTGKKLIFRLILSVLIVQVIINGMLNTYWLYVITNKAFLALIPTRITKELIMIPIEIVTMYLIIKGLNKNIKKLVVE